MASREKTRSALAALLLLAISATAVRAQSVPGQPAYSPRSEGAEADAVIWQGAGRVEQHVRARNPETPFETRRRIVVGLPAAQSTKNGEVRVAPNIQLMEDDLVVGDASSLKPPTIPLAPSSRSRLTAGLMTPGLRSAGMSDQPEADGYGPIEELPLPGNSLAPTERPLFEELIEPMPDSEIHYESGWWDSSNWSVVHESGVGRERLPFALHQIEASQPSKNYRFRFLSAGGNTLPDRAEYIWAKTVAGRGPRLPESEIDWNEFRIGMELGGDSFSTLTEIPFLWMDPEQNRSHAGIGDMSIMTKLVLFKGETWQFTQLFKTIMNTGSPSMGLGTGHISIEPGLLARYKWNDCTYFTSEIKYWVPLGGNPIHSGQVLEYGIGMAHLAYEDDKFAILPTLEVVAWSVLNGQATSLDPPGLIDQDVTCIVNLMPGVRFSWDKPSELGLWELGVSGGFPVTGDDWYQWMWRAECRIYY